VTGGTLRIALYSHDAFGLGHMRRNLMLAEALLARDARSVLMITGAREVAALPLPAGVDCLALPGLGKSLSGAYHPRSLGVSLDELMRLRADTILAAVQSFAPDVLITDKKPLGVERELEPTVGWLSARADTRLVLGLRDVLDSPEAVQREWDAEDSEAAVHEHYHAVWVYGDPHVYDPVAEYGFSPAVAAKVRYTGYLDARAARAAAPAPSASPLEDLGLPPGRLALCVVGGGEDGYRVADAFARAELPADVNGVILTGPFMPAERCEILRRRAVGRNLRVLRYVDDAGLLLDAADRVVAMGGYNTVCELLSRSKRALIVPRVDPRREQLIRAERMRDLGLLDMLHPDELRTGALGAWLAQPAAPPAPMLDRIDLDGLRRVPGLLAEVIAAGRAQVAHGT